MPDAFVELSPDKPDQDDLQVLGGDHQPAHAPAIVRQGAAAEKGDHDRRSESHDRESAAMSTDTLSNVLRAARLTGAVFFDIQASTPSVAETPPARDVAALVMPGSEHGYRPSRAAGSRACATVRSDAAAPPVTASRR
jgi:hypothetical protein